MTKCKECQAEFNDKSAFQAEIPFYKAAKNGIDKAYIKLLICPYCGRVNQEEK